MKVEKLSINKACFCISAFVLAITAITIRILYVLTKNKLVILCVLGFAVMVFAAAAFFVFIVRSKLTAFSDSMCNMLDNMFTDEAELPQTLEEESLLYKINHRLTRFYEAMRNRENEIAKERADLKELISDISHQVKTPLANLKMLNTTLLEKEVPLKKAREFIRSMEGQINKLDFLIQGMIKTSRLETGIISLEVKQQPIYAALAAALGGILFSAEKKQIEVNVVCPENLVALHDKKWTSEALFNILDNAVKYTPRGGHIQVAVKKWEIYLRIDITDTGKGIAEENQGVIFKRFYREKEVHEIEGVGIGLYLTRKIISMQRGYIRVASELGQGATFSVFIPIS